MAQHIAKSLNYIIAIQIFIPLRRKVAKELLKLNPNLVHHSRKIAKRVPVLISAKIWFTPDDRNLSRWKIPYKWTLNYLCFTAVKWQIHSSGECVMGGLTRRTFQTFSATKLLFKKTESKLSIMEVVSGKKSKCYLGTLRYNWVLQVWTLIKFKMAGMCWRWP